MQLTIPVEVPDDATTHAQWVLAVTVEWTPAEAGSEYSPPQAEDIEVLEVNCDEGSVAWEDWPLPVLCEWRRRVVAAAQDAVEIEAEDREREDEDYR